MYVISHCSLLHKIKDQLPDMKEQVTELTGKKFRRTDRFTFLLLASALQACKGFELDEATTRVITATGIGASSTTFKILTSVVEQKYPPKPFHFVNSLGNSASFVLAKSLTVEGSSMAVSNENTSFESALLHAQLNAEPKTRTVLAAMDEVLLPVENFIQRLDIEGEYIGAYEGSHSFLLSQSKEDNCIAQLGEPEYFTSWETVVGKLPNQKLDKLYLNFNPTPTEKELLKELPNKLVAPSDQTCPHPVYSAHNFSLAIDAVQENPGLKQFVLSKELRRFENAHGEPLTTIALTEVFGVAN